MPWRFPLVGPARWTLRKHQDAIDYLREESRVLREQLGRRRLRVTDLQRRHATAMGTILVSELVGYGSRDHVYPPSLEYRS